MFPWCRERLRCGFKWCETGLEASLSVFFNATRCLRRCSRRTSQPTKMTPFPPMMWLVHARAKWYEIHLHLCMRIFKLNEISEFTSASISRRGSVRSLCYGTDFVTTASAFSSFIWGLNFSTLPWPASNYFILCRRWQATPLSAVAGRQLSFTLPSLAGNSFLCRRRQTTLFYSLKTSV